MGDTANLEVQHTVVPSLHFGHLSYTPPPGFAGQLPGVLNVPPGYNYRDTLRSARSSAVWANTNNPDSWQPLSTLAHSITAKRHDPVLKGSSDDLNLISSNEALMPGFMGHVPHVKSNGFPGYSYMDLTRDACALARTDLRQTSYLTESKQAFAEAAKKLAREQKLARGEDGLLSDEDVEPDATDYSAPVGLDGKQMQQAKGVWLEFNTKIEEHTSGTSRIGFRYLDTEKKGYVSAQNVKDFIKKMGIRASDEEVRVLMKGLGCDDKGNVSLQAYVRASEMSLPDALKVAAATPWGGGDSLSPSKQAKPKRLREVKSLKSGSSAGSKDLSFNASFLSNEGSSSPVKKKTLPMLVFTPRQDPVIQRMVDQNRFKSEGGRHRHKDAAHEKSGAISSTALLAGGKRFGTKYCYGYAGHQPTWRTEEWDHIQNQLTLRVKPMMRMQPPRMRSLQTKTQRQDEIDESSSAELREAKAAWSLIMENFEEFKKVQKAFRLVDKDFSGVISREELRALIENTLYIVTSDAAFDIIFRTIDTDGSGEISFDEFAAAISNHNIELSESVATDAAAQAGLAKRQAMQSVRDGSSDDFDVGPTDALALFAKNETLRIHGQPFVIQNLRKKVDDKFYEIKANFQMSDPEGSGSMGEDEFVRLMRVQFLAPEGPGALVKLVETLRNDDGSIDYLLFLSSFGAMGSHVQMVESDLAHKAKVDRQFARTSTEGTGPSHLTDGSTATQTPSGSQFAGKRLTLRSRENIARKQENALLLQQLTHRSVETAESNQDQSHTWQDRLHPGKPASATIASFQDKYKTLCRSNGVPLTEQGEAHAPALQQEDGSHAQRYPLKRLYVMDGDTTVEKLEAGKQIKESKSDDCLFGVHIGHHKGNKKRDSLQSKLDSVPISTTQEAEKVWRLLRQHAETTHGSMQRAFRTVDRDGSGRIEITELRHLVAVHLSIDLEEDLLQFIFHCLDRGDKGAITYQEFVEALQGPLVSRPGASALEMQEHPLSKTFGQALASQRAPSKHSKSWDSFVTTASKSGDRILQNGAASYQLGDRHAWKSMNMYETTSLVQQRAVKESFGVPSSPRQETRVDQATGKLSPAGKASSSIEHESTSGSLLRPDTSQTSAPTIAAYARQAGVEYVDASAPESPV